MESLKYPSDKILNEAIGEIKEPVIFQGILNDGKGGEFVWKLFEWNLSELAEKFGDTKLPFRVGHNAGSAGPQWDINGSTVLMTLAELIQNTNFRENDKQWYYFDYKYMHKWFKDRSEIINSVSWKRFGIDKNGEDSTLWIGSKGAHTNCHQDSYGCNLVAQIHGRKQWLLFPPSSSNSMQPTRVPYEESTVYSKYNFFSPTKEEEANILRGKEKPLVVTLEPGDVLFVPPGWWHYVESLDLTVSVNIWLPISTDDVSRVKEAIAKLIVTKIGMNICNVSDEEHCTWSYCMNLLEIALKECKKEEDTESSNKKIGCTTWSAKDLAREYPTGVKLLRELDTIELEEFLKSKRERFSKSHTESLKDHSSRGDIERQDVDFSTRELTENIVNALCHPDVINKVTELLLL